MERQPRGDGFAALEAKAEQLAGTSALRGAELIAVRPVCTFL
jgi:hypothetical protein